jgi:DNA-binding protein HU-beta
MVRDDDPLLANQNAGHDSQNRFDFRSESHLTSAVHFAHLGGLSTMAKATKPTAAAKSSRPVTLKHLAATLAEEHQLTKRAGEALLGDLVDLLLSISRRASESALPVLASCRSGSAARMGRNPATGEAIKIKASKKVAFRAAKELKLAV